MAQIDKYIEAYIKIRDQIAVITDRQKEELAPYKDALAKIESAVLSELDTQGVESVKTAVGTAYKSKKVSVTVADKSAFMDYIRTSEDFDLLDIKANKTAVEAFLEENEDLPPGISRSATVSVNFRR